MPCNDQMLFDFNAKLIFDYDDEKAHTDLEKHGDAFRFQLIAALYIDHWVSAIQDDEQLKATISEQQTQGWVNALQNVAAYLRNGHFLPGGAGYEQVCGPSVDLGDGFDPEVPA